MYNQAWPTRGKAYCPQGKANWPTHQANQGHGSLADKTSRSQLAHQTIHPGQLATTMAHWPPNIAQIQKGHKKKDGGAEQNIWVMVELQQALVMLSECQVGKKQEIVNPKMQ